MEDAFKKFLYAGVDLVAEASNKFQHSVTDLVEKGKISDKEGKKLVDEFFEKTHKAKDELEKNFNSISEKFGFAKSEEEELERLKKRVKELEAKAAADKPKVAAAK